MTITELGELLYTKLTLTVFNTGLTDAEKRKRLLMDLLAEKLKSSEISSSTITWLSQISRQRISMFPSASTYVYLCIIWFLYLEVNEAQKRGLKIPTKIMDFLWDCKSSMELLIQFIWAGLVQRVVLDHIRIFTVGLELACNRGSWENLFKCKYFCKLVPVQPWEYNMFYWVSWTTLGARGFSCAVSGFEVSIMTRATYAAQGGDVRN